MAGLVPSGEQGGARETSKTLPTEIRQLIVDLHAEASFMSWREIAEVCYIRYGRRPDHKSVVQVRNPCVTETIFRSPQLALFDLGPDEWLLYWKAPSYAPRRRHAPGSNITQLILFEVPVEAKAAGAETAPPFLRLVRAPQEHEQE